MSGLRARLASLALLILLALPTAASAQASWTALANTTLQAVCPPNGFGGSGYFFFDNCKRVTDAWSGGTFDPVRQRLMILGGGHVDYSGNEVYALDASLATPTLTRLNNPTLPLAGGTAGIVGLNPTTVNAIGGSAPNSRHTYAGVTFVTHSDEVFIAGGSLATNGSEASDTRFDMWLFKVSTLTWRQLNPTVTGTAMTGGSDGHSAAYLAAHQRVYFHQRQNGRLYRVDTTGNGTATSISTVFATSNPNNTAFIDPVRQRYIVVGGGEGSVHWIDLTNALTAGTNTLTWNTQSVSGSPSCISSGGVGAAYDSAQDRYVLWCGGSAVDVINPATWANAGVTVSGAPALTTDTGTTFGRFQYNPTDNAFYYYGNASANAFRLRLTAGGGTPTLTSIAVTPASPTIAATATQQFVATGTYSDASQQVLTTTVTWASSSTAIATISNAAGTQGRATGFAAGSTTISATSGAIVGSTTLTVTSGGGGADADFAARCAAPGVTICQGFDDPALFVQATGGGGYATGLYGVGGTGTLRGSRDTVDKTSGAGSLVFTIPANAGQNDVSGYWNQQFKPVFQQGFAQGDTFYIQFAHKLHPAMQGIDFKWFVLYTTPGPSCTENVVMENNFARDIYAGYQNCSSPEWLRTSGGINYRQQGANFPSGVYNCPTSGSAVEPPCLKIRYNKWVWILLEFHIGTWGAANSTLKAYLAEDGLPYKQFVNLPNWTFDLPGNGPTLNTIQFVPYITTGDNIAVPWTYHIDEVIVSTQPIAAPGLSTGPTPPPTTPGDFRIVP